MSQVPLDYSDPSGEKAAIALIRIKANISANSREYRGPILFNPGQSADIELFTF
jgi:hypothetical protein